MGRRKDEALQHAYAARKQTARKALLHKLGITGAVFVAAASWYCMWNTSGPLVPGRDNAIPSGTQGSERGQAGTQPTRLTMLEDFTHPDVAEVVVGRRGENPIVYLPWMHVLTTTQGNLVLKKHMDIIGQVSRIALDLHDRCGIDAIISEGLSSSEAKRVEKGAHIVDALAQKRDPWSVAYDELLHARKWRIYGTDGEDASNQQPIIKINIESYKNMQALCTDFKNRGWSDNEAVASAHFKEMAIEATQRVFRPYAQSLIAYFEQDPGGRKAFAIQCSRDKKYYDAAQRAFNDGCRGVIIITGAAHEDRIKAHCAAGTNAYYVVRPKSVPQITYSSEEEARRDWLRDLRAYGTEMQLGGKGFSLAVNTGLEDFYRAHGMLKEDESKPATTK